MSAPLFKGDILFEQRILQVSGFYNGPLNNKLSTALDQAETAFDAASDALKQQLGGFDKRSEGNIASLLPAAQRLARQFLTVAANFPQTVRIISGTRTYAEQDALFAIGRTVQLNRSPVTKARGGQSNHNFAIAWDVGIFDPSGKYLEGKTKSEQKAYRDLASLIKANIPALEWGGDFAGFPDPPHYQLRTGKSIKEVRALLEAGKPYLPNN